jgi:transcriptional regulator with XRE-family HTH domain
MESTMARKTGPTLGSTIRRLRNAAGLSQKQMAETLEIAPSYLSRLEADDREPSISLLRRIASELAVPPGLLLALALWTEIPVEEHERYRELIENLVQLATVTQVKLQME